MTTLQPCLMCAATAMLLKVGHVSYAADDEFFVGLDELWAHHPVTAERQPVTVGPIGGPLERFARLLPLMFTLRNFPGRTAEQLARREHPELAAIANRLAADARFAEIVASGSIDDALEYLAL